MRRPMHGLAAAVLLWAALLAGCATRPASAPTDTGAAGAPAAMPAPERSGASSPNPAPPAPAAPVPAPLAGRGGLADTPTPASPSTGKPDTAVVSSAADSAGRPTGWTQNGIASWYGPGFQGRRTANGERFNTNELTAAHKTLPFGTRVRVRSLVNGQEVVVRINDRGPFIAGRIIDLSRAAAQAIGLVGIKRVTIETLK